MAGQQSLPCRGGDFLVKEERGAGPVDLMSFVTHLVDPGKPVLGFGKDFDTASYGTLLDKVQHTAKQVHNTMDEQVVGGAGSKGSSK